MRTSINNIVAIVNVFGFGQDRVVVVSSLMDTCMHAARHLETRHAKRARGGAWACKRPWLIIAVAAGAARVAGLMSSLAMYGPERLPVRLVSPALVLA